MNPRVTDNDRDEITVTLDGKEIRGWSYENDAERRVKMRMAREFVEGWLHALARKAAVVVAVERFDLDEGGFLGERGKMVPSPYGDYVRIEDYAALLKAGG